MNRRDALMLCMGLPAAAVTIVEQQKQAVTDKSTFQNITVLSNKTRLSLALADPDSDDAGVTVFNVTYKGQQLRFTAKEIWDALSMSTGATTR